MPDPKPSKDADLSGDYARDTHRGGFGDDYARDSDETKNSASSERNDDVEIGNVGEGSE